jgi:predicted permease
VLNIFFVTFPFFALIFAGYVATRRRMLQLEAIPGLNGFVLFFALPCMLYRFGASTPLGALLDVGVFLVWLLCGLLVVGFTIAVTRGGSIGWKDAAFGALVAAFPNTGFMGVPLLVALLGDQAAGPTIVAIVVDMVVTSSLCIALSQLGSNNTHGVRVAAKKALTGVISNPMPWAILLGTASSLFDVALPAPVAKTIGLLADAASPVALFTIGAVLARSQILGGQGPQLALRSLHGVVSVVVIKLFLHPVLVLLIGSAFIQLGLPLEPFSLTILILIACLPSASNVSLLAERFGADNGRIARIILATTTAAFFTFSGAVALLR